LFISPERRVANAFFMFNESMLKYNKNKKLKKSAVALRRLRCETTAAILALQRLRCETSTVTVALRNYRCDGSAATVAR